VKLRRGIDLVNVNNRENESAGSDRIRKLSTFSEEKYSSLPLAQLAAYVLKRLKDLEEKPTIENVCVILYRLFPKRFSMVGYPEYPDGMRVNRTLLQLQPKYRNYATGSATKGYMLTPLGNRIAEGVASKLSNENAEAISQAHSEIIADPASKRTFTSDHVLAEVRKNEIFDLYRSNDLDSAMGVHFLAMLDAYAHTRKEELKRKFRDIKKSAKECQDDEILAFLKECEHRFAGLLDG
jgi:hypothetical protein